MKKLIALLLVLMMIVGTFSACGNSSQPAASGTETKTEEPSAAEPAAEPEPEPEGEEEDEENYETGDASLDDPRNQDDIGVAELLVVSFGTSFNDNRRLTIGAIENALAEAFPDLSVRRGFTAQIIIDHVFRRDGEVIDNVDQALQRAIDNGVRTLVVQPTHLMHGFEYDELMDTLAKYADSFETVGIAAPLLTSYYDFQRVADAIVEATAEYDDGKTAICFMGHGTEHESNAVYPRMQQLLTDMGKTNYFIGTVEAEPSLDDVLKQVQAGDYSRVVLRPLMVVAGDHANNDMAGEDEDSWKSAFEAAGYEVVCVIEGLGGIEAIQQLYVEHTQTVLDALDEDFGTGDASLDDPLNQDEIGSTELLVVSFGTSFNDNRRITIGGIENALADAFPYVSVRRGFTAQIIIDHVMRRDGVASDNVTEALERAVANGVKTLVVQPSHLMLGIEYDELMDTLAGYSDSFDRVAVAEPLLTTDDDFHRVAEAMVAATEEYDDGNTAICFMGHGTEHKANEIYGKMQKLLTGMGKTNYFIGTVEAEPSLDDVLKLVQAGNYTRVVLRPMMVVAGDHANNDMAGDEEDSWKSAFEAAGYEVVCVVEGLGGIEAIQQIYVEHTQAAFGQFDDEYFTGDAALDDPLNADDIGDNELLVVSFGTSFNNNRRVTIGGIEKALAEAFPEYSVRRGFTAQIIIDHVKDRDGVTIDNVTEALERAVASGVKNLVVQPTHLMHGIEYDELMDTLAGYSDAFESIVVAEPLLTSDDDFQRVANAIVEATAEYDDGNTAICFMGHGTEHESNAVYARMQEVLNGMGKTNYFVGTVEAEPSLEDVLAMVQAGNYTRVVLRPLMVVAGDHANNDMAGDEEDSWKSAFEAAGYDVVCVVEGLGGIEAIQQLYVEHTQAAIEAAK